MFLNLEKYSKRSYEFHIFKKGFEWKEMDGSSLKDKFTMIRSSSTWRGETKQDWAGSREAGGESNLKYLRVTAWGHSKVQNAVAQKSHASMSPD